MTDIQQIALYTDFGPGGPYVGQMRLRLQQQLCPSIPVSELISDLMPFRQDLAAYLLPALIRDLPEQTLFLCVVDPGVGGDRAPVVLEADGNWFVGPDNGLFSILARRAGTLRVREICWRPAELSNSFHGRDLFAPVAAMISRGVAPDWHEIDPAALQGSHWPEDLPNIIYRDGYGNLMTGFRASLLDASAVIDAGKWRLRAARTFCEVPTGTAFWYENALGLVELSVNQGRADLVLGLEPGDSIEILQ